MVSAPHSEKLDLEVFETLITDALEHLTDKVRTMLTPFNEQLQEINNRLEIIAGEARAVEELVQHNSELITGLQETILQQQQKFNIKINLWK